MKKYPTDLKEGRKREQVEQKPDIANNKHPARLIRTLFPSDLFSPKPGVIFK